MSASFENRCLLLYRAVSDPIPDDFWSKLNVELEAQGTSRAESLVKDFLSPVYQLCTQGKVKGLMKLYGSEHFGLFERLQQAYYTVFPPAHVMAKRYPVNRPWMLPLAYGRRWIALLKKSLP